MVTPGRQDIIFTTCGKVATLGHNDIALVIDRRKTLVSLVASALNYSSFHYPRLPLFAFPKRTAARRPPAGQANVKCSKSIKIPIPRVLGKLLRSQRSRGHIHANAIWRYPYIEGVLGSFCLRQIHTKKDLTRVFPVSLMAWCSTFAQNPGANIPSQDQ